MFFLATTLVTGMGFRIYDFAVVTPDLLSHFNGLVPESVNKPVHAMAQWGRSRGIHEECSVPPNWCRLWNMSVPTFAWAITFSRASAPCCATCRLSSQCPHSSLSLAYDGDPGTCSGTQDGSRKHSAIAHTEDRIHRHGGVSNFCIRPCTCSPKNHTDNRAACGMWARCNAAHWL